MSSQAGAVTVPDLGALAELIRQRRRAARLTQGALASRAGVGRSTIHRLERLDVGPLCPTPQTVAAVLDALEVRPAAVATMVGGDVWGLEVLARLEDLGWATGSEKEERWLRADEAARVIGIEVDELPALKRAGLSYHKMPATAHSLCLYLPSELLTWRANHARLPLEAPPWSRAERYRRRDDQGLPDVAVQR
jgi:transcriptional regulator with XRE-family HTH domain